jgi:hypothetical protein
MMKIPRSSLLLLATACVAAGCIRPPELVVVDRATALEQQAAGSFAELEERLLRVAATPRPTPLAPEQLAALGIRAAPLVDNSDLTDADRVDLLLKQRCVGEGKDGTLVETATDCQGAADHELIATLLERTNRARAQLWRWMHDRRPTISNDELRKSWREAHLKGVVCDGWIEKADGKWEPKAC